MSSFVQGLQAGQSLVQHSRDMEEIARQREMQRQRDADAEAIRKAMLTEDPAAVQPPQVRLPRAAEAGTQEAQAPVQAAAPMQPPGASIQATPLAPPTGQDNAIGLPRANLDGTGAANPAAMRAPAMESTRALDMGATGSAAQPAGAPASAAPMAGGATQARSAGQPISLRDATRLEKMNEKYQAMHDEALRRGRPEEALQALAQGMKIRDSMRSMAADSVRQKYLMSNDPQVYADYFNRYIGNGVTIDSIAKGADGNFSMRYSEAGGAKGEKVFKPAELQQWVQFIENPAAARAMEVEHAKRIHESMLKQEEARNKAQADAAVATADHRWQKIGDTLIDTLTGSKYDAKKYQVLKSGDQERLVIMEGNRVVGEVGSGQGSDLDAGLPKPVADMIKSAGDRIVSIGKGTLTNLDPREQQALTQQVAIAQDLIKSSYGSPNWGYMQDGLAAEMAQQIQTGKIKPVQTELGGKPVQMFEYQGRKFVLGLNPFETQSTARGGQQRPAGALPRATEAAPAPAAAPKQTGLGTQRVTGQITKAPSVVKPGDVVDGHRFKGGNPRDPASWEPAT